MRGFSSQGDAVTVFPLVERFCRWFDRPVVRFPERMVIMSVGTAPVLHVVYNGRSHEVPLSELDLGNLSQADEIKAAAARRLDAPIEKFADWTVRHEPTGNITLAPEATFG